jgi:DNA-binding IclR family transcriptional regulator
LEQAYGQLDETMHLMVLLGATVRFVDGVESTQGLRIGLRTGARMPAYCTSAGKAMLADLDDTQLARLYPNGLHSWPTRHITDVKGLRRHLAAVRRRGYGVNAQESEVGVIAIGASVRSPRGWAVAGVSVAVPSVRYVRTDEARLARIVTATARSIEADLTAAGWRAPQ